MIGPHSSRRSNGEYLHVCKSTDVYLFSDLVIGYVSSLVSFLTSSIASSYRYRYLASLNSL
jgi:hypothetical protein